MRIIHSVASLNPKAGGPARSVPQLALAMAKLGIDVALWSPHPSSNGLADLDRSDCGNISIYSGDFSSALDAFGTVDLVHDHGVWLPCHREVAKICEKRNIPRVVSTRGMLEPWALNHKKWKKRLAWYAFQKRDLQSATGLHATAESEAAQLRKLGLKSEIVVAPNGVDVPAEALMQSNTGRKSEKVALFLSRIHPKKGLPMWAEVWQRVQPEGWTMRVVGPDEAGHLAELKELVKQAGLEESWSFEDSLEGQHKWRAMYEADLFVLPTYSENFGIVIAEALASGTPVLTTTGTPWAGLNEYSCGWWCEPTAEALEKCFREALVSTEAFDEMGQRGKKWMQEEFGWEGIAERLTSFYKKIIR